MTERLSDEKVAHVIANPDTFWQWPAVALAREVQDSRKYEADFQHSIDIREDRIEQLYAAWQAEVHKLDALLPKCPTCGGKGEIRNYPPPLGRGIAPCPDCDGSGVIPADRLIALGVEVLAAWRGEDTRTHADVYYAAERVIRAWDALPKAGE